MEIVTSTNILEYPLIAKGKVRDMYEIDQDTLLIVTTDRMSAFDVIMAEPIPYKGIVLNLLTIFWMEKFADIIPNHIIATDVKDFPANLKKYASVLEGRSVIAKKAKPLPLECIVRGYLAGSGWQDYQKTGGICGHMLPKGLEESSFLEEPLFTPSTKAEVGDHDINVSKEEGEVIVGKQVYAELSNISKRIFSKAENFAKDKGLIIADTKFEFGLIDNKLYLIDEVLTPDSSRFWSMDDYVCGKSQPSFDKQYLRDWLSAQDWDKASKPPALPQNVIDVTKDKYFSAYSKLTGRSIF